MGVRISEEQLDEFVARYKKAFRKVLDRADAREMAEGLVRLYLQLSRMPSGSEAEDDTRPAERGSSDA